MGNTPALNSDIGYYLSSDNRFDQTDIFIGSSYSSSLGPANQYDASAYNNTSLTIPNNMPIGAYHILFVADYLNSITESNEVNNTTFQQITIAAPFIDLTAQYPYLYENYIVPGNPVYGSLSILNTGNISSPSNKTAIYLSADNKLDHSDQFISSFEGYSIAPIGYDYRYVNITIPTGTAPGSYYLFFVVDYDNKINESEESNNISSTAITIVPPSVDFALYSFTAISTVAPGNTITTNSTIDNLGNTTSPVNNVGFYLSTNNIFDASDIFIGTTTTNPIYAGNVDYNRNTTLTIPGTIDPGTYYLIAVADYLNNVTESNENNNTANTSLRIVAPDTTFNIPASGSTNITTCTGILFDNGGADNYSNAANGAITINPATEGSKIKLIFNSFRVESCCDGLTIYDGTSTSAPLIGTYTSNPGTIYATNNSGALTLVFRSDGSVVYSGFEAEISCVTSLPLPDLAIQSPNVYATSLIPGMSLTVSGYINNQSPVSASNSSIGYYLSANSTLEASDIYLGSSSENYIRENNSSYQSTSFTLPNNISPGNYYILFVADYENKVTEENETNNINSVPVTVIATSMDLAVQSVTNSSSRVTSGYTFNATANITNTGNTPVQASKVSFYLSSNNTFESTDVLLGTFTSGSISSSGSVNISTTLTIPAETTVGSYYILAIVDQDDTITEVNENNNLNAAIMAVVPPAADLVTSSIYGPRSIAAGATVQFQVSINNIGDISSPPSNLAFYLSLDNTLGASDILIGSANYGSIELRKEYNFKPGFTIPANTAAGSYYVLAKVDYDNSITENNEANNLTYQPITVQILSLPDLTIQSPSTRSTTVNVGRGIDLSATIANLGNASASRVRISYYLSTNNTLEESDIHFDLTYYDILTAGARVLSTTTPTIPRNTVPGDYFILIVADSYGIFSPDAWGAITESNKTNNIGSLPITITSLPDLLLSHGSTLEAAASPGGTISVTGGIRNVAYIPTGSSTVGYYLSSNNTLDENDILLGTFNGGPLAAVGETGPMRETLTIPANTVPGNYFIIYVADYNNAVTEFEENNNRSYSPLSILGTTIQPDLIIENMSSSLTDVESGKLTTISGKVKNVGNANANSSNIGIYLSANNTLEPTDILLTTRPIQTLLFDNESNFQAETLIPLNTDPGTYFILVKADNNNEVTESNENNNSSSLPITVISPASDLKIQSLAVSTGTIMPGGTITATATITNIGTSDLSASKINYYLSANNSFENTDVLLGESVLKLLTPNSSAELTVNLTIPATTVTGNYYLIIVINNSVINKKDETSTALRVSTPTGIKDLAADYSVSVSPNPTPDKVNIQIANLNKGERIAEITLYNANGSRILSANAKVTNNKVVTSLDVHHLSNGAYILHIQVGDALVVKKVIIQKN